MNSEHMYIYPPEPDEEAWDVFLPDGDDPLPEEGDFWIEPGDFESEV